MKTFFNVLYRRILYKIPLKLLLILVAVFGLLFACFSSADFSCYPLYVGYQYGSVNSVGINWDGVNGSNTYCLVADDGDWRYDFNCEGNRTTLTQGNAYCVFKTDYPDSIHNVCVQNINGVYNNTIGYVYFPSDCLAQPYSSLQCQTEYNLIPISSVDSAYCVDNNFCPGGDLTPGVSNIFINDLFHPGAFNIIMNIPQEIDWDYAYTNSGQNLNIDVVGYNVDYEKMQTVIDNQNYKPSSEDLSLIVSTIVPLFVPGLVVLLFLYFVFRFIKKIF